MQSAEQHTNEIRVQATVDNTEKVAEFIGTRLQACGCPFDVQMQIAIAVDEIFGNVVDYAYETETGFATVRIEVHHDPSEALITFSDEGIPYDPLKNDDPDTTLPPDARSTGGLGVYFVKNIMDDVSYEYREGQNILRMRKSFTH